MGKGKEDPSGEAARIIAAVVMDMRNGGRIAWETEKIILRVLKEGLQKTPGLLQGRPSQGGD